MVRDKDKAQRTTQFTRALQNMKILAEGGTLPPPPPRSGGAAPPGGTRQALDGRIEAGSHG